MASEWQTAFVVSHKMLWCALLTAVKNYNKSLFVLEAPRDQDSGLEDYITDLVLGYISFNCIIPYYILLYCISAVHMSHFC